jgi:hypothetical protein
MLIKIKKPYKVKTFMQKRLNHLSKKINIGFKYV